ncbi:hypothetical protein JCM1840_007385 [Sporobolomyces johnsonii]
MSFASLAGGAECGPVNPLAQLSKTFSGDRGAQQDHFGSQAGSSKPSFRHPAAGPSSASALPSDPAAAQFFQPHPRPFDLSSLNRALTPATASTGPSHAPTPSPSAVPAWAQAFAHQHAPPPPHSSQEQEMFAQAFGRPAAANPAWSGEFSRMSPGPGPGQVQQAQPRQETAVAGPAASARLYGQGFAGRNGGPMMGAPMMGGQAFVRQPTAMSRLQEGKDIVLDNAQATDWETAFLAQEASTSTSTRTADTTTSSFLDGLTETRPLTPPLRAHTPLDDSTARDALAQTAAALLSTVRTAEDQRLRSSTPGSQEQQVERDVGDKFAQSSFMDLMRRLRDGEVAVEGDQVVEQVQPYASASKGKARADGWATDFAATLSREEEGRANPLASASAPPTLRPGEGIEQFARAQHAWADRQAESAHLVREMEQGYQTLEGLWEGEDRARAQRERAKADADAGKGKERAPRFQFQGDGGAIVDSDEEVVADTHVPLAQSSWEEDFDDASMIVGGHALGGQQRPRGEMSAQQKEWDMLQRDWDDFEVTATGLQPKDGQQASTSSTSHGYAFAQNNPYVLHRNELASSTHHHSLHDSTFGHAAALSSARFDSLLQHEASVQHSPYKASAWFSLGLKQQENEREELAIAALRRALELDSSVANGAAHLALAVSYTNEAQRGLAYEEIDRWVDALAQSQGEGSRAYANEIEQYRNLFGARPPEGLAERHSYLTQLLIRLAQSRAESVVGGVDADVQIALGVLFNSSDDYDKAGDCFEAALSVRPDDPLLFNRLGATLANSGKTDLAIQYYLAALDLQPGYVRARFNLAVANMNLGHYDEAVHHLLTSLSIQEADAEHEHSLEPSGAGDASQPQRGITSQTLWDSLNVSLLQMGRSDLAVLTASRDLNGLMHAFPSN